ncbi:terminase [Paenibacillus sp. FSL P4-0081]|uniref:P27 family phage terminase small subunit n=1 Tax=Paenibacillus sp. FSL P4-0081 TaxID=1536769 RepID=UPI0004F70CFF|nr:P27 family phage terminase small subunit [Paenibacillus sp. FSL P4-0081]AIQ31648.1 terminase [Paenibacillus sp. FSL P4-0081]
MAGRNAKPVALHIAEGNPNRLTKEEIKQRTESELKLGKNDLKKLKKPKYISQDKVANKLWGELIKEYQESANQGVSLLSSTDVGTFALYCKTYSEYENLLDQYQKLENIVIDEHILDEYIGEAEAALDVNLKALQYLSQLASLEGILKVETAINKKVDMLLKLQDRLFLNPLAKVKNVTIPKKEDKKSAMAQFMSRRAGGSHGT